MQLQQIQNLFSKNCINCRYAVLLLAIQYENILQLAIYVIMYMYKTAAKNNLLCSWYSCRGIVMLQKDILSYCTFLTKRD